MKRFFAFLAAAAMLVALSACTGLHTVDESNVEYWSEKQDTETAYYSALDINVATYSADSGSVYELQIGLRRLPDDEYPLDETHAETLAGLLSIGLSKEFSYEGNYSIIWDFQGGNTSRYYTYYCFSTNDEFNLVTANIDYGFFYVRQDLRLNVPQWVSGVRLATYMAISGMKIGDGSAPAYTIDSESIKLRYFLGTDESLTSENATRIYKTYNTMDGQSFQSLMWDVNDVAELSKIQIEYKAMAPGWYIIPIVVGALCVIILLLVCKYRKPVDNIFRKDEAFAAKERDVVLDGQISMDELKREGDESDETEDENGR